MTAYFAIAIHVDEDSETGESNYKNQAALDKYILTAKDKYPCGNDNVTWDAEDAISAFLLEGIKQGCEPYQFLVELWGFDDGEDRVFETTDGDSWLECTEINWITKEKQQENEEFCETCGKELSKQEGEEINKKAESNLELDLS